jgi:pimeloyl-ACP methyl ester carboxylesterase
MPHPEQITIQPGLTFDVLTAGEPAAPMVLLLHGFAESMRCWRAQVATLGDAGYRALAPSQRGYSPGARPDTGDTANYHIDRLMDDAMASGAFISPATTGAAASPGRWRIVIRSG